MIIAQIIGGLGNQLFQYANARRLSILKNQPLKLDISFYKTWKDPDVFRLDKFNTKYTIASEKEINIYKRQNYSKYRIDIRLLNKIFKKKIYKKNRFHVDYATFENDKYKIVMYNDLYLSGYWTNEIYFKDISTIIRKEFTLRDGLNFDNQKILSQIQNSNSISIHIRRGDYVSNPYFANIPLSYYHKAINFFKKKFKDYSFYVFSDDLKWAKENLGEKKLNFVNINDASTDYMDLILMSNCKHNIMANSTFSWWGAWLNNNPNKIVIAPKIWYNDKKAQKSYEKNNFIIKDWIKL